MDFGNIKRSDIINNIGKVDGSVKEFLENILNKEDEIRSIKESMMVKLIFIPVYISMKNEEKGAIEKSIKVKRTISADDLTKEIQTMLNSVKEEISIVKPKNMDVTQWYEILKSMEFMFDAKNAVNVFRSGENLFMKEVSRKSGFGMSIALNDIDDNLNFTFEH